MRANTGAITFVAGPPDRGDIVEALRRARHAILRIPHPEEPDDPFASFASEVTSSEAGWTFSVDMADAEAYPGVLEAVLAAVVEALEELPPPAVTLGFPAGAALDEAPPPTPEPYDGSHYPTVVPEVEPLPASYPDGFPLPMGVRFEEVQVGTNGTRCDAFMLDVELPEPAEWYPSALAAQGFSVASVTSEDSAISGVLVTIDFQGQGLMGAIRVNAWPQRSTNLGAGYLSVVLSNNDQPSQRWLVGRIDPPPELHAPRPSEEPPPPAPCPRCGDTAVPLRLKGRFRGSAFCLRCPGCHDLIPITAD